MHATKAELIVLCFFEGPILCAGHLPLCLSHAGTKRDPPPYWDIFVQWEQGFLCNESLYFNFRPCGADLSSLNCILMHVITHRA